MLHLGLKAQDLAEDRTTGPRQQEKPENWVTYQWQTLTDVGKQAIRA